jgi:hypothetical protein
MFVKIHKSHNIRPVVAICDDDLIGKKFEEGKRQLDVRENFYKGEQIDEEQALHIIRVQSVEDASFNIVGKNSIKTAIKAGLITEKAVAKLKNIPFALVLL